MKYLSFEQLIRLNRRTVEAHGGNFVQPDNLLHEEALRYITEIVDSEMFGQPLYPTAIDKAAVYCFNIISNHIFQDGNKRTGIGAAQVFLLINGFELIAEEDVLPLPNDLSFDSNEEQALYNFTIEVASGKLDLEEVRTWFQKHSRLIIK